MLRLISGVLAWCNPLRKADRLEEPAAQIGKGWIHIRECSSGMSGAVHLEPVCGRCQQAGLDVTRLRVRVAELETENDRLRKDNRVLEDMVADAREVMESRAAQAQFLGDMSIAMKPDFDAACDPFGAGLRWPTLEEKREAMRLAGILGLTLDEALRRVRA